MPCPLQNDLYAENLWRRSKNDLYAKSVAWVRNNLSAKNRRIGQKILSYLSCFSYNSRTTPEPTPHFLADRLMYFRHFADSFCSISSRILRKICLHIWYFQIKVVPLHAFWVFVFRSVVRQTRIERCEKPFRMRRVGDIIVNSTTILFTLNWAVAGSLQCCGVAGEA